MALHGRIPIFAFVVFVTALSVVSSNAEIVRLVCSIEKDRSPNGFDLFVKIDKQSATVFWKSSYANENSSARATINEDQVSWTQDHGYAGGTWHDSYFLSSDGNLLKTETNDDPHIHGSNSHWTCESDSIVF